MPVGELESPEQDGHKALGPVSKEYQPSLSHIPRQENARADELSNAAMDAGQILEKEKTKGRVGVEAH